MRLQNFCATRLQGDHQRPPKLIRLFWPRGLLLPPNKDTQCRTSKWPDNAVQVSQRKIETRPQQRGRTIIKSPGSSHELPPSRSFAASRIVPLGHTVFKLNLLLSSV
ncbi:hypothetical protein V8E54_002950 [Elaphomyces granulatus]